MTHPSRFHCQYLYLRIRMRNGSISLWRIGPVADDRVYASFALYEAGLLNKQSLIAELKAYKLVNQILLHTEASLASIKFLTAYKISK